MVERLHGAARATAIRQLAGWSEVEDRDAIRKIVQALVQSTSEMELRNRALETSLRVSKQRLRRKQWERLAAACDPPRRPAVRKPA